MMNFNSVFNKPPADWTKVKLLDNSPCKSCRHQILLRELHPGNTCYSPLECSGCKKRIDWVMQCLYKLEWYEKQEKENYLRRNKYERN